MSPSKPAAKVVPLPRRTCAFCKNPALFVVSVEDEGEDAKPEAKEPACGTHLSATCRLLMKRHDAAVVVRLARGAVL